ncbi:MAG TPA: ornithine carbamoyltransferase, partial [Candidatus Aenigmarchaeota archaeon]|nr:ornithine carbamoyltransferase [Candidatus Aenigmarchaeota archaeon]
SIACPPRFKPNKDFIDLARKYSNITKAEVKITKNPEKAAKDANVIYTSSFGSKRGKKIPSRYKVTEKLFEVANSDCVFMHSLPINRGEEVTSKVIDDFRSIIFEQAENKLHILKAIFVEMLPETLIKLKLHL